MWTRVLEQLGVGRGGGVSTTVVKWLHRSFTRLGIGRVSGNEEGGGVGLRARERNVVLLSRCLCNRSCGQRGEDATSEWSVHLPFTTIRITFVHSSALYPNHLELMIHSDTACFILRCQAIAPHLNSPPCPSCFRFRTLLVYTSYLKYAPKQCSHLKKFYNGIRTHCVAGLVCGKGTEGDAPINAMA
jgi:hypothetical protein